MPQLEAEIVSAAGVVLMGMLVTLAGYIIKQIRRHARSAEIVLVEKLGHIAVKAAEQMGQALGWDGARKLDQAERFLESFAAKYGVVLTDEQKRSVIESVVHTLHEFNVELTAPDDPISAGVDVTVTSDPPAEPEPTPATDLVTPTGDPIASTDLAASPAEEMAAESVDPPAPLTPEQLAAAKLRAMAAELDPAPASV